VLRHALRTVADSIEPTGSLAELQAKIRAHHERTMVMTAEPETIEDLERAHPNWQAWKGNDQLMHARKRRGNSAGLVTGESVLDLSDEITLYEHCQQYGLRYRPRFPGREIPETSAPSPWFTREHPEPGNAPERTPPLDYLPVITTPNEHVTIRAAMDADTSTFATPTAIVCKSDAGWQYAEQLSKLLSVPVENANTQPYTGPTPLT